MQKCPELAAELLAEPRVLKHRLDCLQPGCRVLQSVLQQLGQIQHLDTLRSQGTGERVMFLLRALGPWQRSEQHPASALRCDSSKFRPRPVNQHSSQPSDLTVYPVRLG